MTNHDIQSILMQIAAMCGHPDPAEACRMILEFCVKETAKLEKEAE